MLYEGYSPFSQTGSELSSIGAPNARKLLDTLVVGRPDQERLDGPCPPTAASIWVLTSTSCGIVPQPADEGQHRGREKAADEQSERASRRAMRPIPTPTDKPEIARVLVWVSTASARYRIPRMK